jgi:proline dehydrogenase
MLGEEVLSQDEVEKTAKEYSGLLSSIQQQGMKSTISIKPTQLGLSFDEDYCLENYRRITKEALEKGNFVWLDMEGSRYTEKTVNLYSKLVKEFPNTGVAIQAYLKRSQEDVRNLLSISGKIRIVKGAYNEDAKVAYKSRSQIKESYLRIMQMLFSDGNGFAIATHDNELLAEAKRLSSTFSGQFEYQMLLGVRDKLKANLVKEGKLIREYIPYGKNWLPYSIRRLRERKRNILLLFRSLLTG